MAKKNKNELGGQLFVKIIADMTAVVFISCMATTLVIVALLFIIEQRIVFGIVIGCFAVLAIVQIFWIVSGIMKQADFADFVIAFALLQNGGELEKVMKEKENK